MSYMEKLSCPRCEETHSHQKLQNLCSCGSPLLVDYDLKKARKEIDKEQIKGRTSNMWRYKELLPVNEEKNIVSLGEGDTPLYDLPSLGKEFKLSDLMVKDEGLNPTGSFKARGASTGISRAKELGAEVIAMPTAGNAGSAWAAYSSRGGLKANVAMPKDTPELIRRECLSVGANIYEVEGLISDAGKFITQKARKEGWFEVATLKEPYRIEGKKTMGYEIAEQLDWQMPDVIIYPTGGGVGLIGIWKAIEEMEELGWIPAGKRPKMIAVQSSGCAPIVRAFNQRKETAEFWENAETIAPGIRVPKALGDFLILKAIYESEGVAVLVSDAEIKKAVEQVATKEGLFICPEAGAAFAALEDLRNGGIIGPEDKVVVLNTGTGLKTLI